MIPAPHPLPRLTREQVRRVDRICVEEFGIPGIVLMENAARAIVTVARELLSRAGGTRVLIVCGGGNNGGDGYAAARHLYNAGYEVAIGAHPMPEILPSAAAGGPGGVGEKDAQINARICDRMGLRIEPATPSSIAQAQADLVIDALLGTGLDKPPREDAADLIRAMNARRTPILAVDVPSGLDCDTGRPLSSHEDCIRANVTVTMAADKAGFAHAHQWTGVIVITDIGAPPEAIGRAAALQC